MKSRALILPMLYCLTLTGCIESGTYLGGLVKVETGMSDPVVSDNANRNTSKNDNIVRDPIDESRFGDHIPYREGQVRFSYHLDVDTTFVRLKKEFKYVSKEELRKEHGDRWSKWMELDLSYQYEAIPGVHYKMKNRSIHNYNNQDRRHNIYCELNKNGNQTEITFEFWIKDPDLTNLKDYGESLKVRALSALK